MEAKCFVLGSLEVNSYVLHGSEEAYIIDPGENPEPLLAYLDTTGLTPRGILLTHAHIDHIAGLDRVLEKYPELLVRIHGAETSFLEDPAQNLSVWIGQARVFRCRTLPLADGDLLELEGSSLRVIHTPGHSPGGVGFYLSEDNLYIGGDLLFRDSIGRTDFPHSDPEAMGDSLSRILDLLPGSCRILPGHGPETSLAREQLSNLYLVGRSPKGTV